MDFPLDYIPSSGSQLERALREYFRQTGAVPDPDRLAPDNTGDGGIFLTLELSDRQYIGRTILAHEASEEVQFTGNQLYQVDIVDQFPAHPAADNPNPTSHRVAIDRQVGLMLWWMQQSDDGGQTFSRTAKNITDAGRSLAPTSFQLVNCGNAAINGFYDKTDNETWDHRTADYHVIWNETEFRWELQDGNAVILYTIAAGSLPNGTWAKGTANDAVPQAKFDSTWNNADMANFTCLFVLNAGQSRGHPADDMNGVNEAIWREVRRFSIKVAPSVIPGYSNTAGA